MIQICYMLKTSIMKILLVGGGSGGPVSPMLAIAEHIKKSHPKAQFLLVGTDNGPEKHMAQKAGIAFASITAGKLRRYFSWKNFGTPFLSFIGFIQSFKILNSFKPDCVFGTGSFVQVPLVWAAWIKKNPGVTASARSFAKFSKPNMPILR